MSEMVVGRSRRKAVASLGVAVAVVAGTLLFAEHDASARVLPRRSASQLLADTRTNPTVIQNIGVVPTGPGGTTQTGALGQVVLTDDITVVQNIIFQVTTNPGGLTCPQILAFQAVMIRAVNTPALVQLFGLATLNQTLVIIQNLFLGCPVASGTQ